MRLEERRYSRALKHREEKKGAGISWGWNDLKYCRDIPLPLCTNLAVEAKAGAAADHLPEGAVIDEKEILVINLVRSMMG